MKNPRTLLIFLTASYILSGCALTETRDLAAIGEKRNHWQGEILLCEQIPVNGLGLVTHDGSLFTGQIKIKFFKTDRVPAVEALVNNGRIHFGTSRSYDYTMPAKTVNGGAGQLCLRWPDNDKKQHLFVEKGVVVENNIYDIEGNLARQIHLRPNRADGIRSLWFSSTPLVSGDEDGR